MTEEDKVPSRIPFAFKFALTVWAVGYAFLILAVIASLLTK